MSRKYGGAIVEMSNVIIAHRLYTLTPEKVDDIDSIQEIPEALESLAELNHKFNGNVTVVYKATPKVTEKIVSWLVHNTFRKRTGILYDRVVQTTNGPDKSGYINQRSATYEGTSVVVDSRFEALRYFIGKVPHLFLFHPQAEELEQLSASNELSHVHIVGTWKEIREILRSELA
jgi:hypothetical protein